MIKHALLTVVALLSLCHSVAAQSQIADRFLLHGNGLLGGSSPGFPPITLTNQERFSLMTTFGWQAPVDYLPPFATARPRANTSDWSSSLENVPEIQVSDRIHVGGELGFLYGRSTGKYGYEFEQGYILGEIGNEWFHVTVGMSHESVSGHGSSR